MDIFAYCWKNTGLCTFHVSFKLENLQKQMHYVICSKLRTHFTSGQRLKEVELRTHFNFSVKNQNLSPRCDFRTLINETLEERNWCIQLIISEQFPFRRLENLKWTDGAQVLLNHVVFNHTFVLIDNVS